ncbi:hypothetical protein OYE22_05065 [Streptomyces sp. 71268]|uniref:hypothetical protein n=1 Tax=Streptomyces sp. 71268 TaxID=3002640 RepID=UPI0023F6DA6F|nr:hypothetical protein [Streptomyces sp. 71268]WEV24643.1 hypothetical protein OYE22_05065 [Streptomyces sp. 71268]
MAAPVPLRLAGARAAVVVVAALATGAVAAPEAPAAEAPGADIRIHDVDTPVRDPRDERTVCAFYLVAADVPDSRELPWRIAPRPNPRELPGIDGTILIEAGRGHTGPYTLPSGGYELTWNGAGEEWDEDRRKAFTVACPPGDQGQPPTNDPPTNDPPPAADETRGDAPDGRREPATGREGPAVADEDWLTDTMWSAGASDRNRTDRRQGRGAVPAAAGRPEAEAPSAPREARAERASVDPDAVPAADGRQPRGAVAAGGGGEADAGAAPPGVGTALAVGAVAVVGLVGGRRARRRSRRLA